MSPYQYVTLRCVPRPDREEFLNVGVVLFCEDEQFLGVASELDEERVRAFAPDLDIARLRDSLQAIRRVCAGSAHHGYEIGVRATAYGTRQLADTPSARFGLLKAPRSTVLQPGPVHGGMTDDAQAELQHLLGRLVG
ncbi:hypothetical protein Back2_01360 [Nocardioides baekrokdamisoli]|uniref:DUF3037 domain-containing protein n=1 Tax=Nocardioides baekrokdamisoli TaxID=1804624 RepID=A0A3G9IYS4_9ACTN|nr:DUF3037 domain-containing protein [Nocardioides baekrokdamisoli]BBH15849.1 hypothetical protein Back2_01360 [Nocardioides baekrokdamisoli]